MYDIVAHCSRGHGREDALIHWCMTRQIKARELNLVGYEDEEDE